MQGVIGVSGSQDLGACILYEDLAKSRNRDTEIVVKSEQTWLDGIW